MECETRAGVRMIVWGYLTHKKGGYETVKIKKGDSIYSCGCVYRGTKQIYWNPDPDRFFPFDGCPYHKKVLE